MKKLLTALISLLFLSACSFQPSVTLVDLQVQASGDQNPDQEGQPLTHGR